MEKDTMTTMVVAFATIKFQLISPIHTFSVDRLLILMVHPCSSSMAADAPP